MGVTLPYCRYPPPPTPEPINHGPFSQNVSGALPRVNHLYVLDPGLSDYELATRPKSAFDGETVNLCATGQRLVEPDRAGHQLELTGPSSACLKKSYGRERQ